MLIWAFGGVKSGRVCAQPAKHDCFYVSKVWFSKHVKQNHCKTLNKRAARNSPLNGKVVLECLVFQIITRDIPE